MQLEPTTRYGVTLKVYPGAHHGFDSLRRIHSYRGHVIGRHPEAAAKGEDEVKLFLARHLLTVQQTAQ